MAKTYDAASKHLIEAHPADWLKLVGFPLGESISVVDADVSSFSLAADKVIRVDGILPYIAHFEFQSASDSTLDRRILLYNVLLRWRHNLPVRSVVILLRREAMPAAVVGRVLDNIWPENWLDFGYKLVKVWEQPTESLLSGGIGTLPLAPISAVAANDLPAVIQRMEQRFSHEARQESRDLEAAAYILMGLRYPKEMTAKLLAGVRQMKESVTYQAILEEGEAKGEARGEARGERTAIIRLGTKKFGPPPQATLDTLYAINDLEVLNQMLDRILEVSSWDAIVS